MRSVNWFNGISDEPSACKLTPMEWLPTLSPPLVQLFKGVSFLPIFLLMNPLQVFDAFALLSLVGFPCEQSPVVRWFCSSVCPRIVPLFLDISAHSEIFIIMQGTG